jgi:hypothetical protein
MFISNKIDLTHHPTKDSHPLLMILQEGTLRIRAIIKAISKHSRDQDIDLVDEIMR